MASRRTDAHTYTYVHTDMHTEVMEGKPEEEEEGGKGEITFTHTVTY